MKVKDLIERLQKENQEDDVHIEFNGCTESGTPLAITEFDRRTYYLYIDSDGNTCQTDCDDNDSFELGYQIIEKKNAVILYSNRDWYDPFPAEDE